MSIATDVDYECLQAAYRTAASKSTDPSTQNGAILVVDGRVIARGANHFPRGVVESEDRFERPLKYSFIEHAERNSIYEAARLGRMTSGATMYCPWFACADCGRAIIQAGVVRVVGHKTPLHASRPDWQTSIAVATQMLTEAGVRMDYLEGSFDVLIRFDGEAVRV